MLTPLMIGNKISEARKKINISQAQLGQRLSISSQAVGKWERGESMPDITTFNRMAEILGVDLNYFSENFQSEVTIIASEESMDIQPAEFQSGKQKKNLNWDMSSGNWVDADFSGLKNLHDKFSASNMQRCLFIGSDLSGLLLKNNHVDNCNFSNSDISNSQIRNSHLVKNLYTECLLKKTEFSNCHIASCDFTNADCKGVIIKSSSFIKNKLGEF